MLSRDYGDVIGGAVLILLGGPRLMSIVRRRAIESAR